MRRFFQDVHWALMMLRVRRYRRKMLFSQRMAFDAKFRRHASDGALIAFPDCIYHATEEDLDRALAQ